MRVTIRQLECLIHALQWIVVATAALLALDTMFLREPIPKPHLVESLSTPDYVPLATSNHTTLDELASIWSRDLRQTLIKPEPKPKPRPKPPPPPAQVTLPKLAATFVEDGKAWGVFVDQKGATHVRPVGGRIQDFNIVNILPGSASLRREDKTFDVEVPRPRSSRRQLRGRG